MKLQENQKLQLEDGSWIMTDVGDSIRESSDYLCVSKNGARVEQMSHAGSFRGSYYLYPTDSDRGIHFDSVGYWEKHNVFWGSIDGEAGIYDSYGKLTHKIKGDLRWLSKSEDKSCLLRDRGAC